MAALENVAAELRVWYTHLPELWDFSYTGIDREETIVYHGTDVTDPAYQERGKACPAFADPEVNHAPVLDAIDKLKRARNQLKPNFWVELLIAVMRHNSSTLLRNLVLSWLPGRGESSQLFEEGLQKGYGPHTLLLQECERRRINIAGGRFARCQWSMGSLENWPDERRGREVTHRVQRDVRTMRQILRDAENPNFLHRTIIKRVQKIRYIGPVKALSLYVIATHAGFLTLQHAMRKSHNAFLHGNNPATLALLRAGVPDLDMALSWLAWRLDKSKKVIEHSLLKFYHREHFCWDFIANEQRLYCCRREVYNDQWERTTFYRREVNGPWQEYTPNLPGF